jgi:hypothetical protein
MQISSLGGSQGLQLSSASIRISAYKTAKTHFTRTQAHGTAIEEDEECTQVFVKGPGNQTSALQVESNFVIIHVQFRLSQSTFGVPFDSVFYTFGRKVLNDGFSLKIPHNATLVCNPQARGGYARSYPDDGTSTYYGSYYSYYSSTSGLKRKLRSIFPVLFKQNDRGLHLLGRLRYKYMTSRTGRDNIMETSSILRPSTWMVRGMVKWYRHR